MKQFTILFLKSIMGFMNGLQAYKISSPIPASEYPNLKITGFSRFRYTWDFTRDLNKDLADKDTSRWTIGLNYYFSKNVLWRTNFEIKTEKPAIKNNIMATQIQIKF